MQSSAIIRRSRKKFIIQHVSAKEKIQTMFSLTNIDIRSSTSNLKTKGISQIIEVFYLKSDIQIVCGVRNGK